MALPTQAPAELLERAEVLGVATSALSRAAQGEPSVVFIVGEPGLGKTSVLERCCVAGRQAGFSVQRAACSEPWTTFTGQTATQSNC